MSVHEAVRLLRHGGDFVRLYEAIIRVTSDKTSSLDDIMLGLQHPGIIKELAALALHRRTRRPYPTDPLAISMDLRDWLNWLRAHPGSTPGASHQDAPEPARSGAVRTKP